MTFEDDAEQDGNSVPTIQGVSKDDTEKPVKIAVNPDSDGAGTHGLVVEIG